MRWTWWSVNRATGSSPSASPTRPPCSTRRGDISRSTTCWSPACRGVLRAGFIDHDALFAGRWLPYLDSLLAQPEPPERPRVDGAEVAAALLLDMM